MNDHGHIVGVRSGIDDGSSRAFLYAGGASKDLGVLLPSHTSSAATAINNAGQIVGVSSQSWISGIDEHAFIYEGGRMSDLNAHIPANYGWVLKEATDINVHGQIVGRGTLNGGGAASCSRQPLPPCCSQSRTPRRHSRSTLSHRPPIL